MRCAFGVTWVLLISSFAAAAQPAGYFADHMVLQRGQTITVWGTAEPGAEVSVSLSDQSGTCVADDSGYWALELMEMDAGGPYQLVIGDATGHVRFDDVMIGEVWFCGGQSNMMWPVYLCNNSRSEIDQAKHPWLRLARVHHEYATEPREDVGVNWWVCSPETIANFGATPYYFGRELKDLGCAVALVDISWGGSCVEAWIPRVELEKLPSFAPRLAYAKRVADSFDNHIVRLNAARDAHNRNLELAKKRGAPAAFSPKADYRVNTHQWPYGLYNSIIHPLRHVHIRGIAFYQGESNANRAVQYRELFPILIRSWRATLDQGDFPFIFVQLAGFKFTKADPQESEWAELREAQSMGLAEPNTAMVLTIDIGDRRYIHPTNKQELGRRLALAARSLAYGDKVTSRGPYFRDVRFTKGKATVTFDGCEGGEMLLLGDPFKAFAIAGDDKRFWWADVSIKGNQVTLSSPMVDRPVAVRYNWADFPLAFLYNSAGLPAEPFRTDDWRCLTDGRW